MGCPAAVPQPQPSHPPKIWQPRLQTSQGSQPLLSQGRLELVPWERAPSWYRVAGPWGLSAPWGLARCRSPPKFPLGSG